MAGKARGVGGGPIGGARRTVTNTSRKSNTPTTASTNASTNATTNTRRRGGVLPTGPQTFERPTEWQFVPNANNRRPRGGADVGGRYVEVPQRELPNYTPDRPIGGPIGGARQRVTNRRK